MDKYIYIYIYCSLYHLAALTGEQSVVVARYSISTHWTAPLDLCPALRLSLQIPSWEILPQINEIENKT